MILREAIAKWSQSEGEAWFINHLTSLVAELNLTRDYHNLVGYEDLLWDFFDQRARGKWSKTSELIFIEFALDTSLLIGSRDLFHHFYHWLIEIEGSVLSRHHAAQIFLSSLNNTKDLHNTIDECRSKLEESLSGDIDEKWTSLSLVALVDLAESRFPRSQALPQILNEGFAHLFQKTSLSWFLTDLSTLNPDNNGWLKERDAIIGPLYERLLGVYESSQEPDEFSQTTEWEEHLSLLNGKGNTIPVHDIVQKAKTSYNLVQDREVVWASLERGTTIINSTEQLDAYLASYGTKHVAKLRYVLQTNFPNIQSQCVVDWACGQGLGTLTLLNTLENQGGPMDVVLVDPSYPALCRAEYLVRMHAYWNRNELGSLHVLNGFFEKSTFRDLTFSGPTIHIFSNILDMESVDLNKTHELIFERFSGPQLFFLISPFISRVRSARLLAFQQRFSKCRDFTEHVQIDRDFIKDGNASITARAFSCTLYISSLGHQSTDGI